MDWLVSIITPTFNAEAFIAETIESIQAQTYENWELLITDDCSTDDSVRIIERYAANDPRIRLFKLEKNSGAGVARNNSIEKAKGRFIAFCDSDDRWLPTKLEKQIHFMLEKDCALSYTSYLTTRGKGCEQGIVVGRYMETFTTMKHDDGIGCLTAIYDTRKVGKMYMPPLRKRQDWALWLKILIQCKYAYGLKEPLAIYRLRNDSISAGKKSLVKYNIAVYREVLGWCNFRATLYFWCVFAPNYILKKLGLRYINR